jgi:hypothetical protein
MATAADSPDCIWGNASNVPVAIADFNGDGKARPLPHGHGYGAGSLRWTGLRAAILAFPGRRCLPTKVAQFHAAALGIFARLTGAIRPRDADGLYENEVIIAFDGNLRQIWESRHHETSGKKRRPPARKSPMDG